MCCEAQGLECDQVLFSKNDFQKQPSIDFLAVPKILNIRFHLLSTLFFAIYECS